VKRYVDKAVAAAALVLLLVLIVFQVVFIVSARNEYVEKTTAAKALRETVDSSNPPDMSRDPDQYSGKVFDAWEKLTFPKRLGPWDLYPDWR